LEGKKGKGTKGRGKGGSEGKEREGGGGDVSLWKRFIGLVSDEK